MTRTPAAADCAYRHARRVAWRRVAGSAVILDVETATYYSLEGVGLRIWELIGQGLPLAEIARELEGEYDAPAETIRGDLEALVRRLRQEKIIEAA